MNIEKQHILTPNKRIAKNTIVLYVRMLIMTLVSLYTSRIVLNVLGVEDYGIYTIVGGLVVLFSFLQNALSNTTQRFITFELGKGNSDELKKVFNLSLLIHIGVSVVLILLAETIGLWFIYKYLNIPAERMNVAIFVYHFSVLATVFGILKTPYNAVIIAYEKMSIYAYMSIAEALLKLLTAYMLLFFSVDSLKLYAILICIVSFIIYLSYWWCARQQFEICKFSYIWDKKMFIQIAKFSGWNLFGSSAVLATTQGTNILLNIFSGVMVNASMGIANQVGNAIGQFVTNFQVAFNPQITKLYAASNLSELDRLIFRSAKISFFLLLLIAIPIIIDTETILFLWLGKIPMYASEFCKLTLMYMLVDTLCGPLYMLIYATGSIRKYQLIISTVISTTLLFSYLFLLLGYSPIVVLCIRFIISVVTLLIRVYLVHELIPFSITGFVKGVIGRTFLIGIISISISYLLYVYLDEDGLFRLIIVTLFSTIITLILIYGIGLDRAEKSFISEKVRKINMYLKKR